MFRQLFFPDGFGIVSSSVFSPEIKNVVHFLIGCSNHEIQSKLQLRDPELRDTLPEKMKWPYVS